MQNECWIASYFFKPQGFTCQENVIGVITSCPFSPNHNIIIIMQSSTYHQLKSLGLLLLFCLSPLLGEFPLHRPKSVLSPYPEIPVVSLIRKCFMNSLSNSMINQCSGLLHSKYLEKKVKALTYQLPYAFYKIYTLKSSHIAIALEKQIVLALLLDWHQLDLA